MEGRLTSQKVTLKVLGMEISLVAMRAREHSISILSWNRRVLRGSAHTIGDDSTARNAWEDSSTTLRSDHLCSRRLLSRIWGQTIGSSHAISAGPDRSLTLRVTEGTRRHCRVIIASVTRRRRGNGLRVGMGIGRRRQQSMRGLELLRLILRLSREERRRRQAVHGSVRTKRRRGGVHIMGRSRGIPQHIRSVRLSHVRCGGLAVMRLQWRQRVRLGDGVLRMHWVLRHMHAGQWSRTLRKTRRRGSRRVRTRVHGDQLV
jgi:hypothetical protein